MTLLLRIKNIYIFAIMILYCSCAWAQSSLEAAYSLIETSGRHVAISSGQYNSWSSLNCLNYSKSGCYEFTKLTRVDSCRYILYKYFEPGINDKRENIIFKISTYDFRMISDIEFEDVEPQKSDEEVEKEGEKLLVPAVKLNGLGNFIWNIDSFISKTKYNTVYTNISVQSRKTEYHQREFDKRNNNDSYKKYGRFGINGDYVIDIPNKAYLVEMLRIIKKECSSLNHKIDNNGRLSQEEYLLIDQKVVAIKCPSIDDVYMTLYLKSKNGYYLKIQSEINLKTDNGEYKKNIYRINRFKIFTGTQSQSFVPFIEVDNWPDLVKSSESKLFYFAMNMKKNPSSFDHIDDTILKMNNTGYAMFYIDNGWEYCIGDDEAKKKYRELMNKGRKEVDFFVK